MIDPMVTLLLILHEFKIMQMITSSITLTLILPNS